MQQEIQRQLRELEQIYNIRILYACEAGSRAYGLHTKQSDFDVRFIFKYHAYEYLKLQAPKEVIQDSSLPQADIQGWDLYKSLHLFSKSNPSLYEWLHSPVVYIEDAAFAKELRVCIQEQYGLKSIGFHYWQLIKSNLKKRFSPPVQTGDIKISLHIMRAYLSLQFMFQHHSLPPLSFHELVRRGELPKEMGEQTLLLQKAKQSHQAVDMDVCLDIMKFGEEQLPILKGELEKLNEGKINKEKLNEWIISLHKEELRT
jgi:predicted nucleotidyltransferase